ncbi:MAG TPA: hypothetical protein VLM38_21065 [Blastocatellia bacterium]|nr:hypothetical protein [Blastocatellia bacterium]
MSDTHSIDAILHALYETISGPAGAVRDWNRFRSLLYPGARLVRTFIATDGKPRALPMDGRAYEDDTADYFRQEPFYETEVARRIERFGNIAHVFSVYEARHAPTDAKAFKRGINSVQLFNDGDRWWVVSMLWDNEREDNPIPEEYLA